MVDEKLFCARCGSAEGVQKESSRTMYANPEDNKPVPLCRPCAKEHHEYWDEMWQHVRDFSGCY